MEPLTDRVLRRGRGAGLDAVGVTSAAPFPETRRLLEERRAAGLHGGMAFTYRNPARSTDPSRTMDGAASLVVAARRYPSVPPGPPHGTGPSARVARYATEDHYAPLRAGLGEMAEELRADGHRAVVLADDNALVDRAAAHRAGLGWFGKNANLLLPGRGSWFVLGSVLTDAPLDHHEQPVDDGCGACRRCLDGCPTGAIVAPGVVDARRCLAWLLQAEGDFPEEHRVALGDRIYGCDDCQEVCPPNRRVDEAGPAPTGARIDVLELLDADDEALLAAHGRWYVPRRDPRYLRRNALVVLGNSAAPPAPDAPSAPVGPTPDPVDRVLRRYLDSGDDLLVTHAAWAARRCGRGHLVAPDMAVRPRPGEDGGR